MSTTVAPVFKILPTIQQYDWGKIGKTSKVAQLAAASHLPGFTLHDAQTYAELWMGTHPKSPSLVSSSRQALSEHLKAHPSLIGQNVIDRFGDAAAEGNLPFLFKVLSIHKALSIQAHPDKKMAEGLHASQPEVYKDPNHKPEMALALTPFRALCGFRPLPEIAAHLNSVPELANLIPAAILQRFLSISSTTPSVSISPSIEAKQALKDVFSAIMTAEPGVVNTNLQSLCRDRGDENEVLPLKDVLDLVKTLNTQFPGDVGAFCPFLLNYVTLNPGEAIFLSAGEPHAYIEGDIMECMANSDNVIRAGLTPKLRDIPNLVSCLTYMPAPPSEHVVEPASFPESLITKSLLYDPPIPEFSVLQVKLLPGEKERHPALDGPSVLIVTTGGGGGKISWGQGPDSLDIGLGDVVFVGAGTGIELVPGQESGEGMVLYRAFVQIS